MQSLLVVRVNIVDSEKWQAYTTAARPILQEYGATVIVMDSSPTLLNQGDNPDMLAVIAFPSKQQIIDCYQSEAYQNIVSLRDEAAHTLFIAAGPANGEISINPSLSQE